MLISDIIKETPLCFLGEDEFQNKIYIKRDDLIPFSFGGNKVRIAIEFLSDMRQKGKDCIVGYGNARSNLSRALMNLCEAKQIPCYIISPSEDDGNRIETFNSKMVKKLQNGGFIECNKNEVSTCVKEVLRELKSQGYEPYYIYGDEDGCGNEITPLNAYINAYKELLSQKKAYGVEFDYIFTATGTGMTQAGLIIGQVENSGKERIVGISIARSQKRQIAEITKFVKKYYKEKLNDVQINEKIEVIDQWLVGGYGKYNEEISTQIMDVFNNYGIPLDPTYTGKAYYGMNQYIHEKEIRGRNILFLHTGGTPLFFDFLDGRQSIEVVDCKDKQLIIEFLKKIDKRLPTPLSNRVDLEEYSNKVVNNGHILAIIKGGKIVSAGFVYCNDVSSKKAYVTLLATVYGYENRGYGKIIFNEIEKISRENGMNYVRFETEKINEKAIKFHIKNGYEIIGIKEKIYMEKKL